MRGCRLVDCRGEVPVVLVQRPAGPLPGSVTREAARAAALVNPRSVTRGLENQVEAVEVGIDWLTVSGWTRETLGQVRRWAAAKWGEPVDGFGRHGYARSWRFEGGAEVWFEPRSKEQGDGWTLSIPGSVLQAVSADQRVVWACWLWKLGVRCSRLDVAIDYRGPDVRLVEEVRDGCRRGELMGLRRYSVIEERKNTGGATGLTVYLGSARSTDRPRVCVYDKGLESGEHPANRHQRWECRFRGDSARAAFRMLMQSEGEAEAVLTEFDGVQTVPGWRAMASRLAFGSFVEFRQANGRSERARRSVCAWFMRWREGIEAAVVAIARVAPTLRGRLKAALPHLQRVSGWAVQAGLSVEQIVRAVPLMLGERVREKYVEVEGFMRWLIESEVLNERRGERGERGLPVLPAL